MHRLGLGEPVILVAAVRVVGGSRVDRGEHLLDRLLVRGPCLVEIVDLGRAQGGLEPAFLLEALVAVGGFPDHVVEARLLALGRSLVGIRPCEVGLAAVEHHRIEVVETRDVVVDLAVDLVATFGRRIGGLGAACGGLGLGRTGLARRGLAQDDGE